MLNQIETFTQLTYGQLIGMTFLIASLLICFLWIHRTTTNHFVYLFLRIRT